MPFLFQIAALLRQDKKSARVVKLVDTADLKSAAYLNKGRAGSIPAPGTKSIATALPQGCCGFFFVHILGHFAPQF